MSSSIVRYGGQAILADLPLFLVSVSYGGPFGQLSGSRGSRGLVLGSRSLVLGSQSLILGSRSLVLGSRLMVSGSRPRGLALGVSPSGPRRPRDPEG